LIPIPNPSPNPLLGIHEFLGATFVDALLWCQSSSSEVQSSELRIESSRLELFLSLAPVLIDLAEELLCAAPTAVVPIELQSNKTKQKPENSLCKSLSAYV